MKYWSCFQSPSVAVTLGPGLIVLCFLSVWIELQVRILSPLCCTDLTVSCISRWQGICPGYYYCCSFWRDRCAAGLLVRARGLLVPVFGPQGDLRSSLLVGGGSHRLRQQEAGDLRVPVIWPELKIAVLLCYILKANIELHCLKRRFSHRVLFSLFMHNSRSIPPPTLLTAGGQGERHWVNRTLREMFEECLRIY